MTFDVLLLEICVYLIDLTVKHFFAILAVPSLIFSLSLYTSAQLLSSLQRKGFTAGNAVRIAVIFASWVVLILAVSSAKNLYEIQFQVKPVAQNEVVKHDLD